MADCYPERLPASAPDSERRVMEALASALDDTYTIFHSVAWHAQSRKPDGEADFLIAHPEHGFLVLEVKGGAIDFDARTAKWSTRDRHGDTHPIKDPFDQALAARGEIIRELQGDPRWPRGRMVQIGFAVMFPDMQITESGFTSRGPRDIVLGKNDLPAMGDAILRRFRHWQDVNRNGPPGPDGVDVAVQRFGRTWSYQMPIRDTIEPGERRIVELTDQQMEILETLSRQRRAAIGGCAGSGKSLVAIAKAQELAKAGKRVLLTCFNRALAQHWRETLDLADGVEIRHFHGYCRDQVMALRVKAPQKLAPDDYAVWLPTGLLEAIDVGVEPFDAIIVDEGQDFTAEWLETLELLVDRDAGIFYVFFDDNQRLYQSDALPAWLGEPYPLTRNVRNCTQVGTLVRQFYDGPMRLSDVDGMPVQVAVEPPDANGVPGKAIGLRTTLKQLRDDGALAKDIVVLTYHRVDWLLAHRQMGPWRLRTRDEAEGDVLVETIHSFKGQDRPIVILADLGDLPERADQGDRAAEALLYVGMSRARSLLILVLTEAGIESFRTRLLAPTPAA